jgi:hypothetical protein
VTQTTFPIPLNQNVLCEVLAPYDTMVGSKNESVMLETLAILRRRPEIQHALLIHRLAGQPPASVETVRAMDATLGFVGPQADMTLPLSLAHALMCPQRMLPRVDFLRGLTDRVLVATPRFRDMSKSLWIGSEQMVFRLGFKAIKPDDRESGVEVEFAFESAQSGAPCHVQVIRYDEHDDMPSGIDTCMLYAWKPDRSDVCFVPHSASDEHPDHQEPFAEWLKKAVNA